MANFIIKEIPNALTSCNLLSGCVAVVCALNGDQWGALLFIVVGAVFDFFDGFSARLLHVSSPIGKELDSLADDVTFGVAPSAMVFTWLRGCPYLAAMGEVGRIVPWMAFFLAAFSALRLAKFNIDERQSTTFIGLPTPANALFWSALVVGSPHLLWQSPWMVVVVVALIILCCWLLVAEIPMFSLKFKHWGWRGNATRYVFLLSAIVLIALFRISGLAVAIAWYVALAIATGLRSKRGA